MSDHRLEKLLSINRGGADQSDDRWRSVEESMGLQLPGSYKAMVDMFGASTWANFLHVLSPFDHRLNLQSIGNQILEADRETRESFPSSYPLPLYPEPGGLLPWATTDNGDTLYFITACEPDKWPIVIKGDRAPDFEVCFLPPALLVYQVGAGTFQSTIL
jgi:hypothetical protein